MADGVMELQKAIVTKLRASSDLVAIVGMNGIFDRNEGRRVFPSIVLGEAQVINEDETIGVPGAYLYSVVYNDLHLWSRDVGLAECKDMAAAVRRALHGTVTINGYVDVLHFEQARFMRDPQGEAGHGVVTVWCRIWESLS